MEKLIKRHEQAKNDILKKMKILKFKYFNTRNIIIFSKQKSQTNQIINLENTEEKFMK